MFLLAPPSLKTFPVYPPKKVECKSVVILQKKLSTE